mgnify:CR=1 FL=1
MKIAVCVKQVPDTWAEKKLSDADKTLDRESADGVMNELDEYAVEEALQLTEAQGGEVVAISMGPDKAEETVRKALQMGAHSGIHIVDDSLHGSDAIATSLVLAKVIADGGFDLVIFGSESTDARMSVVPAMVAERLGVPQMTFANKVEVGEGTIKIQRQTEYGYDEVEASTPAVVSVVEKINEPRYPSFKGIMAAKKKPIETVTVADYGVDAGQVGLEAAWSKVAEFANRPPKAAGVKVEDDGSGGVKIAEYLSEHKVIWGRGRKGECAKFWFRTSSARAPSRRSPSNYSRWPAAWVSHQLSSSALVWTPLLWLSTALPPSTWRTMPN